MSVLAAAQHFLGGEAERFAELCLSPGALGGDVLREERSRGRDVGDVCATSNSVVSSRSDRSQPT
jgi:hypothetical protein